MNKVIDYPYPVLRNNPRVSGYIDECYIKINYKEKCFDGGRFIVNLEVSFKCNTLEEMLSNGLASIYINYYTDIDKGVYLIDEFKNDISIEVNPERLLSLDTINFVLYVVANEHFELHWNNEMDEVFYIKDEFYVINKNDILAISNIISLSYNTTGESIIRISQVDDNMNNLGFSIDLNPENFIDIKVSREFNVGYTKLRREDNINKILNSSLVFLTISYALFVLCKEGAENYKSKRWFKVMRDIFRNKGIDIEEFIRDSDYSASQIYEHTQTFMNNYFEKSVIDTSKKVFNIEN